MRADSITVTISIVFSEDNDDKAVCSITGILADSLVERIGENSKEKTGGKVQSE